MNNNYTTITYIYYLKDINSFEPRYVGKSNNPYKRLRQHTYNALRSKNPTYKQRWINKVIESGSDIECIILEICDVNKFEDIESKWIKFFKNNGYDLTNSDESGQGNKNREREIIERGSLKVSKSVYMYDLNGDFIKKYKSTREAGREMNISHGNIVKCCNGVFKHTGGYIFKYEKLNNVNKLESPNAVKKKVIEVSKDGKILNEWESIGECSRQTKINNGHISRCCNNINKSIHGRYFQFK